MVSNAASAAQAQVELAFGSRRKFGVCFLISRAVHKEALKVKTTVTNSCGSGERLCGHVLKKLVATFRVFEVISGRSDAHALS